ncbi:MAG: glycosyltransferase family 4 protein [Candidatus Portnoybacteria bacterium]|nr:glycosyltransferase family 4 protein [Candidatus Portnoybacteria bacterium]
MVKKICFLHYGIGWSDGVTTVVKTLADELQKQNPSLKFYFLGGEIKEKILENASYRVIPQLLPQGKKLTKKQFEQESDSIAQKIVQKTKDIEIVIIENPFLGDYHLPAMLAYSLYAKKYKPLGTKVFFRIHDFYRDFPKYYRKFQKLFSPREIKDIVKGQGVDGFLIVNQALREKLIKAGIKKEKIFYLPNGLDSRLFSQPLSKEDRNLIYQNLGVTLPKILLYPVRVIPRKNIEEAILLVSFIRYLTKDNYILLIAGKIEKKDPLSQDYYRMLKKLAKIANFPIIFTEEAWPLEREYDQRRKIKKFSIGDLYQIAQAILMTSLKEGFGYPFLECWLAKKIVLGRRLEEVLRDFEKNGFQFYWLYPHLIQENGKDLAKEEDFNKRIKKVINILKNPALKRKVLKLNQANLLKQVKILQNKDIEEEIIQANFNQTKNVYGISSITQRFLEIISLK